MNATLKFGPKTSSTSPNAPLQFGGKAPAPANRGDFAEAGATESAATTPDSETILHPGNPIYLDRVSVGYRKGIFQPVRRVVHDLTLTVAPGEVVGFLGPNGAGKSSTIKAIMGFVAPDAGEIRLFGHPAGSTAAKARIGYLPEVALYYPFLTPMETLRLYGRLQGLSGSALADESMTLLRRVGLEGKEKQQLKTFSKGMQQRLGIAQALLGNPDLLVLDEVTSGLDPIGRRHLREVLHEVKETGTTIFFSSHELDEVAQLCDRVVMIYQGKVVDERPMDDHLRSGIGSALEDYFVETMERSAVSGLANGSRGK